VYWRSRRRLLGKEELALGENARRAFVLGERTTACSEQGDTTGDKEIIVLCKAKELLVTHSS
jgi:hypothetical protein